MVVVFVVVIFHLESVLPLQGNYGVVVRAQAVLAFSWLNSGDRVEINLQVNRREVELELEVEVEVEVEVEIENKKKKRESRKKEVSE